MTRWEKRNPKQDRAAKKRWRSKNRKKWAGYTTAWRQRNPGTYRRAQFKADILKLYGLSLDDWDKLLIHQAGRCANTACRKPMTGVKEPHIDHLHQSDYKRLTKEERRALVRGLLCHTCNCGIGHFKDSVELLKGAARYLINRTP